MDDGVRVAGRGAPRSLRGDSEDDEQRAAPATRVKKPRSAASFYFLERRAAHGSGVPFFQLKKLLCADFNKLGAEEQAPYQALAKADKERYRSEKAAAGGASGGSKKKKAKQTRRRKKPQGVRMGDSEDEWSDGDDEETESESEEAASDEENEVPVPVLPPAPAPQPAHRRLRRLADAVVQEPEVAPVVAHTATQPVDATPSMGRTLVSRGAAGVGSHYRSVPASTVTSAGGIAGGGGAGDTAHWAPSSRGGGATHMMAPPAPPRWRGGLNGSQRVVTEPSPRVGLDATPGSAVGSVGATPRARGHQGVPHRQGGAEHHASRRRRLV